MWSHTSVSFSESETRWCNSVRKPVTFTARDACQNKVSVVVNASMVDLTPPAIVHAPENVTVGFVRGTVETRDGYVVPSNNENTLALLAWLNKTGHAQFTDLDPTKVVAGRVSSLLPEFVQTRISRGLNCVASTLTVQFSAVDECGNQAHAMAATFAAEDLTPPRIIAAAKPGSDDLAATSSIQSPQLVTWLANHGGAVALDDASPATVQWTHSPPIFTEPSAGACGDRTVHVNFTATDGCNNAATTPGEFHFRDVQAPLVTVSATNYLQFTVAGLLKGATGKMKSTKSCSEIGLGEGGRGEGSMAFRLNNTEVCGGSKFNTPLQKAGDTKMCFRRGTYQKAGRICALAGARLCTAPELLRQVAFKTGCEGDASRTWTSTSCTTNDGMVGRLSIKGGGPVSAKVSLAPKCFPLLSTGKFHGTSLIRCCGDRDVSNVQQQASFFPINEDFQAWLASAGGAIASDAEGTGVVVAHEPLSFQQRYPGSTCADADAVVTFTFTDKCGNVAKSTAKVALVDSLPPAITRLPAELIITSAGAAPGTSFAEQITTWLSTAGNAEAAEDVHWNHLPQDSLLTVACELVNKTVQFWATDDCGLRSTVFGVVVYGDIDAPVITTSANHMVVEAESGNGNRISYQNWLSDHGGAVASDSYTATDTLVWTYREGVLKPVISDTYQSCATNTVRRVIFAVTDLCGRTATTAASFTVVDTTPPVLGCNNKRVQRCDARCKSNTASATWLNDGDLCISDVSPYMVRKYATT